MQLTKKFLFLTLALSLYASSAFALIGDGVDTRTVSDLNVPAPEDIANIQLYSSNGTAAQKFAFLLSGNCRALFRTANGKVCY